MESTVRTRSGAHTQTLDLVLVLVLVLVLLLVPVQCTEPGRRVCQGSSNQLTQLGKPQEHYQNLVRTLSNCTMILENLEITHTQAHHDLSFLQSIEEVGGYVLIAINDVDTVPLPRLRLIRGHALFDGQFSLAVLSNNHCSPEQQNCSRGVRQLLLSNLTEILRGGVKVSHNPLLCHVDSIQWGDILARSGNPALVLNNEEHPRNCEEQLHRGRLTRLTPKTNTHSNISASF